MEDYGVKQLIVGGGVAANSRLRTLMQEEFKDISLILPPLKYCTDNATMIGVAAFHYLKHQDFVGLDAMSQSSLSIES